MGIDHSAAAAGTAGLGTQCPWENAFASKISARLVARESARRTRMSLNGGLSILKPVAPLVNQGYSAVCSPGFRCFAAARSRRRTTCWYSGPKSVFPASQVARREDGSLSMIMSTESAYGRSEERRVGKEGRARVAQ